MLGLALTCLVYGGYGLLMGTLLRRDLESIFALLMLINVDAGWLQNPIYYAGSRSRWPTSAAGPRPAHRRAFWSAFTNHSDPSCGLHGTVYGAVLILLAFGIYSLRMRVRPMTTVSRVSVVRPTVGKLAYGVLFMVVLPALLWAWSYRLDQILELPVIGAPVIGTVIALAGVVIAGARNTGALGVR